MNRIEWLVTPSDEVTGEQAGSRDMSAVRQSTQNWSHDPSPETVSVANEQAHRHSRDGDDETGSTWAIPSAPSVRDICGEAL